MQNFILRTDIQADDTLMLTFYTLVNGAPEYLGFAYQRNHIGKDMKDVINYLLRVNNKSELSKKDMILFRV